jgi:peptide/nickel transport system permease protein
VRFLGSRLLTLVPILFLVSLASFFLIDLLPGDPVYAILGDNATPETAAALRSELGLDDSLPVRYASWLGNALTGDLGESIRSGRPVMDEIVARLPVTLQLAGMAMGMALVAAIPLGMWSAYRAGRPFDRAMSASSFAFISLPPFLIGLLLVFFFALTFSVFPVTGWVPLTEDLGENLRHAFLPALALALGELAVYTQLLRADMVATLDEDYVLAARAKGMPTWNILLRQALRPSSFSLITLAGVNLGRLIGGTVIIEQLFGLPGIGRLVIQAIPSQDMPIIQGTVLLLAVAYVLINTLVDVSYAYLDPRVRRATV